MSESDVVGTALPSWEDARLEAVRRAGVILKDHHRRVALGEDWRMEVTDETGLVLFRLDFTVAESSATLRAAKGRAP